MGCVIKLRSRGYAWFRLNVKSDYLFPRNAAPEWYLSFRKYVSELSSAMYTDSNNN